MADIAAVEWRSAVASLGAPITNVAAYITLPLGTRVIAVTPFALSAAVVARIGFCPAMTLLRTADALATVMADDGRAGQDSDAATHVVLSGLPTKANGGYLFFGAPRRYRGVRVDMDAQVNGTASVLLVEYWNGAAWTTASASDGTASAGATFAQDGLVTWTVPAAWTRSSLQTIAAATAIPAGQIPSAPRSGMAMFWTRWSVSVALDSSTLVDGFLGLTESASYAELLSLEKQTFVADGVAGLEVITDAATASGRLFVNCGAGAGGFE